MGGGGREGPGAHPENLPADVGYTVLLQGVPFCVLHQVRYRTSTTELHHQLWSQGGTGGKSICQARPPSRAGPLGEDWSPWVRIGMSWRAGAMRPLVKATELGKLRREEEGDTAGRHTAGGPREVMVWARRGPQGIPELADRMTQLCALSLGKGPKLPADPHWDPQSPTVSREPALQSRGPAIYGQEAEHDFYIFKWLK